jgi:hypothetical protein
MRRALAGALALGVLVFAGLASGAASFSDPAGDDNAAPDVTSVALSEGPTGTLTLVIDVGNYEALPLNSWFNLWFDLDSNQQTGDAGDEALVRYNANGGIDFFVWDGAELVEQSSSTMTGRFEAGVLTVTAPESAFGGLGSFGFLAVSARGQSLGEAEFVSSDYAPDRGRSAYAGPAPASFPDPGADQDAAPDITSVRVTDTKAGWISFALSTPNYATLPGDAVLVIAIDKDNRASTGDDGADVLITDVGGEVLLEVWDTRTRQWVEDSPPSRYRARNSSNLVTVDVHRTELGNAPRFGFAVTAADINTQAESVLGVDFAPDSQAFWHYTLANRPALVLTRSGLSATPAQPRAGKPFAVSLAVRRSDTNRGITSGAVACRVTLDGKSVKATGTVLAGKARCTFVVPKTAAGARLRGTISVRVEGKSVAADFSYVVR